MRSKQRDISTWNYKLKILGKIWKKTQRTLAMEVFSGMELS
jgi:hypothetical protein